MDELDASAAHSLLSRLWVGSLGIARHGDAHVIPVTYRYMEDKLVLQPRGRLDLEPEEGRACLLASEVRGEGDWAYATAHGHLSRVPEDDRQEAVDAMIEHRASPDQASGADLWVLTVEELHAYRQAPPMVQADEDMDIV